MRGLSYLFISFLYAMFRYQKVMIIDETLSSVTGERFVKISNKLVLNSILHVPNLSYNFLSMGKLSHDLNCVVNFFPIYYEFQDQCMGKRIDNAREVNAYYILGEEFKKENEKA